MGRSRNAPTRSSISAQSRETSLLLTPVPQRQTAWPFSRHGLHKGVHAAGRDTLDVSFLDHRRERLFDRPARLQERREVAAFAQARDAQLNTPGPRFPIAVPIPVALHPPLRAALAVGRARGGAHLQLHQSLGGKGDHHPATTSSSGRAAGSHPSLSPATREAQSLGRSSWWSSGRGCVWQPNPTRHRRGGRLLHHCPGHDLFLEAGKSSSRSTHGCSPLFHEPSNVGARV